MRRREKKGALWNINCAKRIVIFDSFFSSFELLKLIYLTIQSVYTAGNWRNYCKKRGKIRRVSKLKRAWLFCQHSGKNHWVNFWQISSFLATLFDLAIFKKLKDESFLLRKSELLRKWSIFFLALIYVFAALLYR